MRTQQPVVTDPTPRHRHYDEFYGLADRTDGRPLGWVHGNCQAESLRRFLDGPDLRTVRVPAVHELTADDLPHLGHLLGRTDVLVSQPVRPEFNGLPVGLRPLLDGLAPRAQVVRVPVVRFAGLYPLSVIVRPPDDPSRTPPLVAYHDLSILWEAHARTTPGAGPAGGLTVEGVRAVAAHSVRELTRREQHHDTVPVSDLFAAPDFSLMRTINHPGNPVFDTLAARVRERLGLPAASSGVDRPVLDAVHAPRDAVVVEALGLDPAQVRTSWRVDGRDVPAGVVRESHLEWYARDPATVAAGLRRHAEVLRLLGFPA
jgi:hypothetical protein